MRWVVAFQLYHRKHSSDSTPCTDSESWRLPYDQFYTTNNRPAATTKEAARSSNISRYAILLVWSHIDNILLPSCPHTDICINLCLFALPSCRVPISRWPLTATDFHRVWNRILPISDIHENCQIWRQRSSVTEESQCQVAFPQKHISQTQNTEHKIFPPAVKT